MGNAQTRQQALTGTNSAPVRTMVTPADTESSSANPQVGASTTGEVGDAVPAVPVMFSWTHGGQRVFVAGSFNGWREQIPMVRSGAEFHVVQNLPCGVHQFKFVVDGQWRVAPDQPKSQDDQWNPNNVVDLTNYQPFSLNSHEEKDMDLKERFGQFIPNLNDYTADAPTIPMVFSKSALCAVPPRTYLSGGPPQPTMPLHGLCDHMYFARPSSEALTSGLAMMAVTRRYGQKFSTMVFATSTSLHGTTPPTINLLKKAVRRACEQ